MAFEGARYDVLHRVELGDGDGGGAGLALVLLALAAIGEVELGATCGTSVWKQDGQYRVLASLAHMSGSASSAVIPRPEMLPVVSTPRIAAQDWQYTFDNSIPNPAVQRVFAYYGVTMLGGLRWQNQTLYLVNWRNAPFLASIANEQLTIVDPLFSSSLTHTGLTTGYGSNLSLTSLLSYKRQEYEAACILINGDQVTKIEWNN